MEGSTSALAVQVSRLRCVKRRPEPRKKRSYLTFRDHFYVCIVSNYMRTVLSTAESGVVSRLPAAQGKGRVRRIRMAVPRN